MSVSSDRVHVNASRPSCTHCKTRSVSESPGVSQVKLAHFLSRLVCSYYGKDTLKKNLLAKNTRVSIPSAQCSEDNQNCLKASKSSVQKADLEKEESDQTKLTTCKWIVCSDVNKGHLLTSEVKVNCLIDVCEVNNQFNALVSNDTLPLSCDTNIVSINGSVCGTVLTQALRSLLLKQMSGNKFQRRLVTLSRWVESRYLLHPALQLLKNTKG